jgi:hypothetical protein
LPKRDGSLNASLPVQLVDDCLEDPQKLSDSLEDHHRKNWPYVREALLVRLQSYAIDDEAKAAFRELVDAHGYSQDLLTVYGSLTDAIEACIAVRPSQLWEN